MTLYDSSNKRILEQVANFTNIDLKYESIPEEYHESERQPLFGFDASKKLNGQEMLNSSCCKQARSATQEPRKGKLMEKEDSIMK